MIRSNRKIALEVAGLTQSSFVQPYIQLRWSLRRVFQVSTLRTVLRWQVRRPQIYVRPLLLDTTFDTTFDTIALETARYRGPFVHAQMEDLARE